MARRFRILYSYVKYDNLRQDIVAMRGASRSFIDQAISVHDLIHPIHLVHPVDDREGVRHVAAGGVVTRNRVITRAS